jgi:RimJ/RimL family protein N-acetyltransferase
MILEATEQDYWELCRGQTPRHFRQAETSVAPIEILKMLSGVADSVRLNFELASWLIVEDDELVGLCSITRPPANGIIEIGYGIAPGRRLRGIASRAVGDIVAWAYRRADVTAITAETSTTNIASQKVLIKNDFVRVGERHDPDDGHLYLWKRITV